jgi:multidrug transporter EmrE-like cation transporter
VLLRLFLGVSAFVWISYGLFCFINPAYLVEIAGVSSSSATGTTELRAMYGGLQAALGVLAGAALFQDSLQRPALVTLAFVCSGLFMARLLGALLGAEVSSYTAVASLFELLSSTFATRLLVRLPGRAAA